MSYQAEASVRAGRLVPILTRSAPPPNPVQLVHAPQAQQPLKLRAFLDFVAPRLQERLREIATLFALPRDGATCGPSDDANT